MKHTDNYINRFHFKLELPQTSIKNHWEMLECHSSQVDADALPNAKATTSRQKKQ